MLCLSEVAGCKEYVRYVPSVSKYVVDKEESGCSWNQVFKPKDTTLWRVYRNSDGITEIVSAHGVGLLTFKGENGYKNSVGILDDLANAFVNPEFAVASRSIGESEESCDKIEEELDYHEVCRRGEVMPYVDGFYKDDLHLVKKRGLWDRADFAGTWLASRCLHYFGGTLKFELRFIDAHGNINRGEVFSSAYNGETSEKALSLLVLHPIASYPI